MASAAHLEAQRREMIAALAAATRRHDARRRLARRLRAITCDILRADLRRARRKRAAATTPDLFTHAEACRP